VSALNGGQREELARLLERERAKLIRRLRRFGAEREAATVSSFSQHMAEDASALAELETAFLLASEEGRRLAAVNQALDRLVRDPSSFGVCGNCGAGISYERMEAVPYTVLCIRCKRAEEENGSGSSD
jgi:DnaK suppressor protein